MYALKEVLDALQNEPLSSVLGKLEAFATAMGQSELALWASEELNGYDREVLEYRGIGISWVDHLHHVIHLNFENEEMLEAVTHFLIPRGVIEIEAHAKNGAIFPHPDMQNLLAQTFRDRLGRSPRFAGAMVSSEALSALLQRIRAEARRREQQAIPMASSNSTVRTLPDLTCMTDPVLQTQELHLYKTKKVLPDARV